MCLPVPAASTIQYPPKEKKTTRTLYSERQRICVTHLYKSLCYYPLEVTKESWIWLDGFLTTNSQKRMLCKVKPNAATASHKGSKWRAPTAKHTLDLLKKTNIIGRDNPTCIVFSSLCHVAERQDRPKIDPR